MDWLTFIAELVKALAWPVLVLIIFAILRKPILQLIPMLGRFKYGDFEFDFSRRLEEAATQAAALPEAKTGGIPTATGESELLRLAETSPRAAILEAWIRLESAAIEAARRKRVEVPSSQLRLPRQLIELLERSGVIDPRQAGVFDDLRGLRNSAAHASNFNPTVAEAMEYVRIAARLELSLREAA